jgi:hypothetical protein
LFQKPSEGADCIMKESDNLTLVVERTVVMEMEAVAVIGPFNLIDPRLIDLAADIVAEGNRRMALDFSRVSYMKCRRSRGRCTSMAPAPI